MYVGYVLWYFQALSQYWRDWFFKKSPYRDFPSVLERLFFGVKISIGIFPCAALCSNFLWPPVKGTVSPYGFENASPWGIENHLNLTKIQVSVRGGRRLVDSSKSIRSKLQGSKKSLKSIWMIFWSKIWDRTLWLDTWNQGVYKNCTWKCPAAPAKVSDLKFQIKKSSKLIWKTSWTLEVCSWSI